MKDIEREEMVDRLLAVVEDLRGIQDEAEKAGEIGLTGNINMALSYVMAAHQSQADKLDRARRGRRA